MQISQGCASVLSDQNLHFCYQNSLMPLVSLSEISGIQLVSLAEHAGMCHTWFGSSEDMIYQDRLIYEFGIDLSFGNIQSKVKCLQGMACEKHIMTCLAHATAFGDRKLEPRTIEPRCEKTSFLHMQKQRRRSALR